MRRTDIHRQRDKQRKIERAFGMSQMSECDLDL